MIDYKEIDKRVEIIIKRVVSYIGTFDDEYVREEVNKAYFYARDAHEWDFRLSWEPYIMHPVEATVILLDLKPDIHTIQACLLHDVIEDTPKTYEDIEAEFWTDVAFLCAWMEKISKIKYRGEERNISSLRKMLIAMAEDLRVVFIKLSDRLHNMRTLKFHPKKEKRDRIAMETLNIYSPIADRLSLYSLKNSLEEECFKILNIKEYRKIKEDLSELSKSSMFFIKHAEEEIEKLLKSAGISDYNIDFRIKSIYSIYNKMNRKWLDSFKWLYDIFWIRIILNDVSECYKVLWIIHNKWKPIPKKFKDYIALPKPNWYKSLHTTIIWLLKDHIKQPAEIQIKTYDMKEYSDIWVAAHFEYKENWSKIARDIDWVKELKELTESLENTDFMTSLKVDLFKDRIFVFTPKWDSINLPVWSTPIDFAYYVHSDLWDRISIAKVNDRVYPLDKELHNWDIIDVITQKNNKPNPFWLSFVKTTKAKNRIKSSIRKEDTEEYIEKWKDIINTYLARYNIPLLDSRLSILKRLDWNKNNYNERLLILEKIWNFSISPPSLIKRIIKENPDLDIKILGSIKENNDLSLENGIKTVEKIHKDIIIGWEGGIPYRFCYCCDKNFPNKIVAHINWKGLISIHDRKCKVLNNVNKDRLLSAYEKWSENKLFIVKINFLLNNKKWILKDISEIVYSMWINIDEITSKKWPDNTVRFLLWLEISDYDYLIIDKLIEKIKIALGDLIVEYNIEE